MAKIKSQLSSTNELRSVEKDDPRFFIPEEAMHDGSFEGYVEKLLKFPVIGENAIMRGARVMQRLGVDHEATTHYRSISGDKRIVCWNAFNEFHGIELACSRFMSGLIAAALNDEMAFQVFTMVGGPSTAKSAIANTVKRYLTESEPVHGIAQSKVRAHPLCIPAMIPMVANAMVPKGGQAAVADARLQLMRVHNLDEALRFDAFDAVEVFKKHRMEPSLDSLLKLPSGYDFVSAVVAGLGQPRAVRAIVGSPDMAVYEPMMRAARGEAGDVIEAFKSLTVAPWRILDSDEGAQGIAVVKETEPFKFDFAEVYGEEDLSALLKKDVNKEDAVKLIGAYNVGQGGCVEWVEFAKNGLGAIRSLLEATQDRRNRYPAPYGTRTLLLNTLILAHTNWSEYERLVTTPGNEPFEDRFFHIPVLQPWRADAIRKTIRKQLSRADYSNPQHPSHLKFDPLIVDMVGDMLSFHRIKKPASIKHADLKLIDMVSGAYYEPVDEGTRTNVELLIAELGDLQGRDGKTLRWEQKMVAEMAGLSVANNCPYVLSKWVLDWMDRMLTIERQLKGEDPTQDKTTPPTSELGRLQWFLRNDLKKRRNRRLAQMVRISMQIALASKTGESANMRQAYVNSYLDIIGRMQEDPSSVTPEDKTFVEKIEQQIGVASSARDSFREAVSIFRNKARDALAARRRALRESSKLGDNEKVELPLESFEPLRRAVDRAIAAEMTVDTATRILVSEVGSGTKESTQKQEGLRVMENLFELTPDIAAEIAKEVKEGNYLKELGDKDEY